MKKLINRMLETIEHGLLACICLHELGISHVEAARFFPLPHPGKEALSQMARIAQLKQWQLAYSPRETPQSNEL